MQCLKHTKPALHAPCAPACLRSRLLLLLRRRLSPLRLRLRRGGLRLRRLSRLRLRLRRGGLRLALRLSPLRLRLATGLRRRSPLRLRLRPLLGLRLRLRAAAGDRGGERDLLVERACTGGATVAAAAEGRRR